jgi:hypothetical protein
VAHNPGRCRRARWQAAAITKDFGVSFDGIHGPMKKAMQEAEARGVDIAQVDFFTTSHRIDRNWIDTMPPLRCSDQL